VFNGFVDALQFLTRIPIEVADRRPSLGKAVPWFPLVGGVTGAITGGAAALLWQGVPPLVAAAVAVTVGLLITGAFHEDGLGDTADSFGGGVTVERRLQILKDPRQGTYGVCAICMSIVLRVACVASLPGPAVMFGALVAAGALGRAAAVVLTATMAPATFDGLGAAAAAGELAPRAAWFSVAGAVVIAAVAVGWWVGPLALAALLATWVMGAMAERKIGGVVGDVLGAVEVVTECLCLIVVTGLAAHSTLWWP
jgi:adenosylcobinamide-GDP ribazoletransferase